MSKSVKATEKSHARIMAADVIKHHIGKSDAELSAEDEANRIIAEVFASLPKDAFRFPPGIAAKLKLRENA